MKVPWLDIRCDPRQQIFMSHKHARRFLVLVLSLLLTSCAASKFRSERAAAKAKGGVTWTNFVIKNLSRMDSHLSFDEQMADVISARPYASPRDQVFLTGVYQRMAIDKVRRPLIAEENRRKRMRNVYSENPGSGGGGGGGGSSYSSPSSSSGAWDKHIQQQRDSNFQNFYNHHRHGSTLSPSNTYR